MSKLFVLFPSANANQSTIDALLEVLDDVDPRELQAAVRCWARRSRFWPSAAELLDEVAAARVGAPDVEVALVQIRAALEAPCFDEAALHPLVVEAARMIGVGALRDRWSFLVGALRDAYTGLSRTVRRAATSLGPRDDLPPALAAIADGAAKPALVARPPRPELPPGDLGHYEPVGDGWMYRPRPKPGLPMRLVAGQRPAWQPKTTAELESRSAALLAALAPKERHA